MPVEDRVELLDRLAWDFDEYDTTESYSRLHWYPATFVPQLPRVLIDALSRAGETVLDPFCGSGTVLAEAIRLNRRVVGSDINPVARLIAQGRAELMLAEPRSFAKRLRQEVDLILSYLGGRQSIDIARRDPPRFSSPLNDTAIDSLRPWYHEDTLTDFMALFTFVSQIPEDDLRRVLIAVVSSLTKPLSSQTKSWGHLADNVKPRELTYKRTAEHFARSVGVIERELLRTDLASITAVPRHDVLVAADARALPLASQSIDLVLTSFPYPNMSDYTLANRLTLYLLEQDMQPLLDREIGARRKRSRPRSLENFLRDMTLAMKEANRVLRRGAYLAAVLPAYNQADGRSEVVAQLLDEVDALRFQRVKRIERVVPSRRKRQSWGTLAREAIVIWEKQ